MQFGVWGGEGPIGSLPYSGCLEGMAWRCLSWSFRFHGIGESLVMASTYVATVVELLEQDIDCAWD